MFYVIVTNELGNSTQQRIGPFESRRQAEDALIAVLNNGAPGGRIEEETKAGED